MRTLIAKVWQALVRPGSRRTTRIGNPQPVANGSEAASLPVGVAALQRGDIRAAETIADALERTGPADHAAFLRGCCAEFRKDNATRLTEMRHAHRLQPDEPAYAIELSKAVADAELYDEAIALLASVIEHSTHAAAGDAQLHYLLGCWREKTGDTATMRSALERALALQPNFIEASIRLAESFPEHGEESVRARSLLKAGAAATGEPGLLLRGALRLPATYGSVAEIEDTRAHVRRDLEELLALPDLEIERPDNTVGRTAFMLAYHGVNDRAELELLGRVVRHGYRAARPLVESAARPARARPRVGFVSAYYWTHSIGRVMLPLFRGLDRNVFEVRAYAAPGQKPDSITERIRQALDSFVVLPDELEDAARLIARDQLDLLVYPEIGMSAFVYFLAFWRLAPIQCVMAGHPDTTGIDSIDYYLSDGDAEPADAQSHYSEALVRIGGFYLPLSDLPQGGDGPAPGGTRRYICSQPVIKFHPEFDAILAGILKADRSGELVLFRVGDERAIDIVTRRMKASLGPLADRIHMIARQPYKDYLRTIGGAAVMLDTPHFGGGNTTLEALSKHVPVVTQAGEFLRTRFAATRLTNLGLDECVAPGVEAYVETAVTLAGSPQKRARVIEALRERAGPGLSPERPAAQFNAALQELLSRGSER